MNVVSVGVLSAIVLWDNFIESGFSIGLICIRLYIFLYICHFNLAACNCSLETYNNYNLAKECDTRENFAMLKVKKKTSVKLLIW